MPSRRPFVVQIETLFSFVGKLASLFLLTLAFAACDNAIKGTLGEDESSSTVEISVGDLEAHEGAAAFVSVAFKSPIASPTTFVWRIVSSEGAATSDFDNVTGTFQASPGQDSQSFSINVTDDLIYEGDEPFGLVIYESQEVHSFKLKEISFVVKDNDAPPVIRFATLAQSANEDDGTAEVNLVSDITSAMDVIVNYAVAGDASVGSDYQALGGAFTLTAGTINSSVQVNLVDDANPESEETIVFNLSSVQQGEATLSSAATTLAIQDDDGPPHVYFSLASQVVDEGTATAEATVRLSKASSSQEVVSYTLSGDANEGLDYTHSLSAVTFSAGEVSQSVAISLTDDATYEPTESATFTLNSVTGTASISTISTSHTFFITDNETPPLVQFHSPSRNVLESDGLINVAVTVSHPSSEAVEFSYSTAGEAKAPADHDLTTGTITVAAGSLSSAVPINLVMDGIDEPEEAMTIFLVSVSGGSRGSIRETEVNIDDGIPTLSVYDVTVNEGETATFLVSLSTPSWQDITYAWSTAAGTAVAGSDYLSQSLATVTIAAGQSLSSINVDTVNDAVHELSESFLVDLSSPVGASLADGQAVATITDDDGAPVLYVSDLSLNEGSSGTLTISLSHASSQEVTFEYSSFDGTAVAGADYSALSPTMVTLAPGAISHSVNIGSLDDAVVEGSETFSVGVANLSIGSIADGQGDITIIDDETAANLYISDASVTEGETLSFTVSLDAVAGSDVSFDWSTGDDSAVAAQDYTQVSQTRVTISSGDQAVTLAVVTTDDSVYEASESLKVLLSGLTGANLADGEGIGTLSDNEALPQLFVSDVTVNEGETGSLSVSLSHESYQDVVFEYSTSDGTALSPGDFTAVASAVGTISAGSLTYSVDVVTVEDTLHEGAEEFYFDIANATGAVITDPSGVASLNDNDTAPEIFISDTSVSEGGTLDFVVTLSSVSGLEVSFDWSTADGTALLAGVDYTQVTAKTVTMAAGLSALTLSVPTGDDSLDESDEDLYVNLSGASNATINDAQGLGTITDDDSAPQLFVTDAATVTEGSASSFVVSLSAASGLDVAFSWSTANNTASDAEDYTAVASTMATISAGATAMTLVVATTDDSYDENQETYYLDVASATNATISDGQGVGTIDDNDSVPSLYIADTSIFEGETGTVLVSLSSASALDVVFDYSSRDGTATLADSDYSQLTLTTLTIPAYSTSINIALTTLEDTLDEVNETFYVDLSSISNASLADGQGDVTITDDDGAPELFLADASINEGETASLTVSLSAASGLDVSFDYSTRDGSATAADDYIAVAVSRVTIAAGSLSSTLDLVSKEDSTNEATETFYVDLSGANNATVNDGQSDITINDDDGPPALFVFDATVTEGGNLNFKVSLSEASGQYVGFDWSTADGSALVSESDYVQATSSRISISPGGTSLTFVIVTSDDSLYESNESMYLNISNATNATINDGQGLGTINDNDSPPNLYIADASINEGETAALVVSLSEASGRNVSFDYSTRDGTATLADSDYTQILLSTVSIVKGSLAVTISAASIEDSVNEVNEVFYVDVASASNATVVDGQGDVTINNDDAGPELFIADTSAIEGSSLVFTVSLSATSAQDVSFDWSTADNTATTSDSDYTSVSSTRMTIAAGGSAVSLTVATGSDSIYESNETLYVNLNGATNATINDGQGVGTITNDDSAPNVYISDASVTEGGTLAFTVSLSSVSGVPIDFSWSTYDGTATVSDSDYSQVTAASATIGTMQATMTISVVTTSDIFVEADETLHVELSGIVGSEGTLVDGLGEGSVLNDDSVLDLNFADCGNFPAGVTLTRASSGSYWDKDGILKTASNDVPRCQHDPATGETLGLLIEEASTNYLHYSEDFSSTWATALASISPNEAIAPTGQRTADRLVTDSSTGEHLVFQDVGSLSNNTDHALSVFVRQAEVDWVYLLSRDKANSVNRSYFNLATLSVGSVDAGMTNANIKDVGNGWYRLSVTFNSNSGVTVPRVGIGLASGDGGNSFSGDGASGVYVWGAQLQGEAFPSSYIATTGASSATRQDDDVTTGDLSWLASQQGLFLVDFTRGHAVVGETATYLSLYDPSTNNIHFYVSSSTGTIAVQSWEENVQQFWAGESSGGLLPHKVALSYQPNHYISGINSTTSEQTSGLVSSALNDFYIGSVQGNGNHLNGTVKRVLYHSNPKDVNTVAFLSTKFSINGVTGGADSSQDQELSDAASSPTVHWTDTTGEDSYDVTVYQNDSGTVECTTANVPANSTSHTFSGCTLAAGEFYRVRVVAKDSSSLTETEALNSYYRFQVKTPDVYVSDATVTEGQTLSFTVSLSNQSGETIWVDYSTEDNTATLSDSDYTATSGTLTFAPGVTSHTVEVITTDDSESESDEIVDLKLFNLMSVGGGDLVGTGTITNDDLPLLYVSDASAVAEGSVAQFVVSIDATSGSNVTFDWSTVDSSAAAGSDYTAGTGTATIAAGALATTISVSTTDDSLDEATETFTFEISNATNATISDSSGLGTLNDNDTAPNIFIVDATAAEGATLTFTISLSEASGQDVDFYWTTADDSAVAGSDYTAGGGTITMAAGTTTTSVSVVSTDDSDVESNEAFSVNLSSLTNAGAGDVAATGTITNNDTLPDLFIADATATEGETLKFVVSLSSSSASNVTFQWSTSDGTATAGTNYTAQTGAEVTISAGSTLVTLNVPTQDDSTTTSNLTMNAHLYSATNANVSDGLGVGTIYDVSNPPDLTLSHLRLESTTVDGFKAWLLISGDGDSDASVTLWYCNETDSPGCNPESGSSAAMVRKDAHFYVEVDSLTTPNDPGDRFNVRAVATDVDGVTNSPLNGTVDLAQASRVFAAGYNYLESLGFSSATAVPEPNRYFSDISKVAVGEERSLNNVICALTGSGEIHCLGGNGSGQLGYGGYANLSSPVKVVGGLSFSDVTAGAMHACGITTGGDVYCWGEGNRLGQGSSTDHSTPVQVDIGQSLKLFSAGNYATCGITTADETYCWGVNSGGILGYGSISSIYTPVKVVGGHVFAQVGMGESHVCAVDNSNNGYCWGNGSNGELGNNDTLSHSSPIPVSGNISFQMIDGGVDLSCGLDTSGAAYCWGLGTGGALGNGSYSSSSTPVLVVGGYTFKDINAGKESACALTTSDDLYCWGNGLDGTLGHGTFGQSTSPVAVAGGHKFSNFVTSTTSCAVTRGTKEVYCWGPNDKGQSGTIRSGVAASMIDLFQSDRFVSVVNSRIHSCGVDANDQGWCWGENSYNKVTSTGTGGLAPTQVSGGHLFREMAVALYTSCGVTTTGDAYCWGEGSWGETGDGSFSDSTTPTLVSGGHSFVGVSGGLNNLCALTGAGYAYCWGRGYGGALGNNDTTNQSTPVPVYGGHKFIDISSEAFQSCALDVNADIYCWGDGYHGDGQPAYQAITPVKVAGGHAFSQVDVGWSSVCALDQNQKAYCWGTSSEGQLGSGSTTFEKTPVAVAGSHSFMSINVGSASACAVDTVGDTYCWGRLEDLDVLQDYPTPVKVNSGHGLKIADQDINNMIFLTADDVPYVREFTITDSNPISSSTVNLTTTIWGTYDEYCILENDSNVANCAFTAGVIPTSYSLSTSSGAAQLYLWVRKSGGSASIMARSNHAVWQAPPNLLVSDATVTEGSAAQFVVSIDATSGSNVTFDWSTVDGSAAAGSDYTAGTGTATIAAGALATTISVSTTDDSLDEASETFAFEIANASNATISDNSGLGTLNDNDTAPNIFIADASVTEGANLAFAVSLSEASGQDVSFYWTTADDSAVAGSDYTAGGGALTLSAGATAVTLNVSTNDDTDVESSEALTVNLSSLTNVGAGDVSATGTINDNDSSPPTLAVADVTVNEGQPAHFVVSMSRTDASNVTFDWSTADGTATLADSDYTQVNVKTATIAAGSTMITLSVSTTTDSIYEGNETFNVNLTNASGATISDGAGLGTISNNDAAPQLMVYDTTATEGATANFVVSVSGNTAVDIRVDWATSNGSALAGSDFTGGSGTLTISASASSGTIAVPVIDDTDPETEETFGMALSNPVDATLVDSSAVATIPLNDLVWTWLGGGKSISQPGTYGTKGSYNSANWPGGRHNSTYFYDEANDELFVWGGMGRDAANSEGQLQDMWKYSFDLQQWVWLRGSNSVGVAGNYGTPGVEAETNEPGGRHSSGGTASVVDSQGNIWIFGGKGHDSVGTDEGLADLWKYNPSTNRWTFMDGSDLAGTKGVFGTKDVADPSNQPASRRYHAMVVNPLTDNVYIFGGYTHPEDGTCSFLCFPGISNDLWKWDGSNFIWIGGSKSFQQTGVYGTKGQPDSANMPGARHAHKMVVDSNGDIWLFGGIGWHESGGSTSTELNDLWKYDTSTGMWTWVSGNKTGNPPGTWGTMGVADPANVPSGRDGFGMWVDGNNDIWIFGGYGIDSLGNTGQSLNDLWKYDVSEDLWTWMGGSKLGNQTGVYGTLGVGDTANQPGARDSMVAFDRNGTTYMGFGAGMGEGSTTIGVLNDFWWYGLDPGDPISELSVADTSTTEGSVAQFVVSLGGGSDSDVTFDWSTTDNTATAGSDYTASSGSATIATGFLAATLQVNTTDDSVDESNETFSLTVSNVVNAAVADASGLATITDNDATPDLFIANATSVEGTTLSFSISLSTASGQDVSFAWTTADNDAVSGSDYTASGGTVTITSGSTSTSIDVVTWNDANVEMDESFAVNLSSLVNVGAGDISAVGVIEDDDAAGAVMAIYDTAITEGQTAQFVVSLSESVASDVTFDWSTADDTATIADSDYSQVLSTTVTITSGITAVTLSVASSQDSTYEANETFFANISNAVNATIVDNNAQGTINNDDAVPTVNFSLASQTVDESVGAVTVAMSLSASSGTEILVPYTVSGSAAGSGVDHDLADSTVTIPAGSSAFSFTFNVIDDSGDENDEAVTITMGTPTNATKGGTDIHSVTIQDNDTLGVNLTVAAVYPTNSNWNDYVKNDDPLSDVYHQDDVACDGTETTGQLDEVCIHGGEKRKVVATGYAACTNLTMRDELGVFDWVCDSSTNPVVFFSRGLKEDKGLGDLVNATSWKQNRVILSDNGADIDSSSLATWWSNTVQAAPANNGSGPTSLTGGGTIYTVATSTATDGYNIGASKVGFVVLPGATLSMNASAGNNCDPGNGGIKTNGPTYKGIICSGSQAFLWQEGSFDGVGSAQFGFFQYQTTKSVFNNLTVTGATDRGMYLRSDTSDSDGQNILRNIISYNNTNAGVHAIGRRYKVTNLISTNNGEGFHIKGIGHSTLNIRAVGNSNIGVRIEGPDAHTLSGVLVANNGTAGLSVVGGTNISMSNILAINNATGVDLNTSAQYVTLSNIAAANNGTGVKIAASDVKFTGNLLVGSNATTDCSIVSGTNPGLVDGTCANQGASDANLVTGVDTTSSIFGKVTTEDSVNQSDVNGSQTYGSITDWTDFENSFRSWGLDGSAFPATDHRGACTSGSCRIWDFRLLSSDVVVLNTSGDGFNQNSSFVKDSTCPTEAHGNQAIVDNIVMAHSTGINAVEWIGDGVGDDDGICEASEDCYNEYLRSAREIVLDGVGDNDGLCESGEACIYAPNFGLYQGEGDYSQNSCLFQDGTVSGVTLYGYPTNGASP